MVFSKEDLKTYIIADSENYKKYFSGNCFIHKLKQSPISDQWYIWKYIKTMRYCEYHLNRKTMFNKILLIFYLWKLRCYSRKTGIQIGLNTCGKGLTIWHWGSVIVNPKARLGNNCTLYPGVLIGHKAEGLPAPRIGNDVFIGSGSKIIGDIIIGNHVIIAPNSVVVTNVPDNVIIGGVPAKILKENTEI